MESERVQQVDRANNPDPFDRSKDEQVSVARHNQVRIAADGRLDDLRVIRVANWRRLGGLNDDLAEVQQIGNKSLRGLTSASNSRGETILGKYA